MTIKNIIASSLFGIGIAFGFIPILLASLILRHNLFFEIFDRMDSYWEEIMKKESKT